MLLVEECNNPFVLRYLCESATKAPFRTSILAMSSVNRLLLVVSVSVVALARAQVVLDEREENELPLTLDEPSHSKAEVTSLVAMEDNVLSEVLEVDFLKNEGETKLIA